MTTTFTFILSFLLAAAPPAQTPAPHVLASTSNWTITTDDFNAILNSLPEQTRATLASPENRRGFLDDLIQIWVLADEGRKVGTDKVSTTRAMTTFYGNNIVARAYRDQVVAGAKITPDVVEAFYKANPNDFSRVQLSHILILNSDSPMVHERNIEGGLPVAEARKKIEEVKAKMQAGAKFEDLAKEYSQDPGSADGGGDLGFISRGQLTPTVEDAAFALAKDSYSDIIESPFGFHILHVTDKVVPPFEEVEDDIRQQLEGNALTKEVESKVKSADVKIDEEFFK